MIEDYDPAEGYSIWPEDDKEDDQDCPACDGTGEGQYDGQSCANCNGKGYCK